MMLDYNDVGVVILAAGKGSRMKSDIAKVLHKVAGKSMVVHVVECALKITRDNIHVVVGHQAQKVKEEVGQFFNVKFALQEKLLGTGDAVKAALPGLTPEVKDLLVLCGDVPLIQEKTLKDLIYCHRQTQAKVTVLATDVDDSTGYGRMIMDAKGNLVDIREEADASGDEKKIKKINAGIYLFDTKFLCSAINALKPDNNQAEYYLTDVVSIAQNQKQKISVITMDDPNQAMGVNTLEQLAKAEHLLQGRDG
ncbi:MAG: NTP transferase domain-containing protein [Desulfobacula sp.]|nr:NTP transferase domain-containing protein [Desulfobacula sp.]